MKKTAEKLQISLLTELEFLAEGSSLLLAVSGGADSIAMLDALSCISKTKKIQITVAHFNHGLRPESVE